jgi:Fur family ferric uptake transcriptional regulator
MKAELSSGLEAVIEALRIAGCRITPQRRAVLAELVEQRGHINPAELSEQVAEKLPGMNAATVYRTLWLLDELGILTHTHLEDGVMYHQSERADHVHLSCSRCGSSEVLEAKDLTPLARLMQQRHGFAPDFTHFAIGGVCARCRAAPEKMR